MENISLYDLVARLADNLRDYSPGTTTTGLATNTFSDTSRASTKDKHWVNSEIIFAEPAYTSAGNTGVQPFVVTNSVAAAFTLDHNARAAGTSANLNYMMLRHFGMGTPYRGYLNALKYALDKLGMLADSSDASLVTATGTYEYVIPAGLKTLHTVEVYSGTAYGPWELRPDQWQLLPGRVLRLTRGVEVAFPWNLTLRGRVAVTLPTALDTTLLCNVEEVIEYASEYLNRTSNRAASQQKGANQQQERLRTKRNYIYPNEQELF